MDSRKERGIICKRFRWVGRFLFCRHTNIQKIIYIIVIELRKTIKKSMATGVAQGSFTALFPLWFLRRNEISKMKKIQRGNVESNENDFNV